MLKFCIFVCSAFFLTACSYGETEFQIYNQAYDTQYAEGSKVMDRLGEAERTIALRQPARQNPSREFDPNDAAYVLNVGDPPLTAGLRRALDSLKSYNEAMTGLVSGTSSAAIAANLVSVNSNLDDTVKSLRGVTGDAVGLAAGLAKGFNKLIPVFELIQKGRSRAEFRRQLLAAYPDMRVLIKTMRDGTPEIFAVLKRSREGRRILGTGGSSFSSAALEGLSEDRRQLSGWVILLDKTLLAMDGAMKAVEAGSGAADLSDLVAATVDLKSTAAAIKASD